MQVLYPSIKIHIASWLIIPTDNVSGHVHSPTSTVKLTKTHLGILYRTLFKCAPKWEDIGVFLELDPDELGIIKSDEGNVNSRLRAMLSLWLKQIEPMPTKSKIVKVLRELNFNEAAEKLNKILP